MGEKAPFTDKRISHTICKKCVQKLEEEDYEIHREENGRKQDKD
jgi:hypothetical protein